MKFINITNSMFTEIIDGDMQKLYGSYLFTILGPVFKVVISIKNSQIFQQMSEL